jgi:hypothetical protein
MLAILMIPDAKPKASTAWRSDLSGLPLSTRRAYGRLISTPFTCQDASIKQLKPMLLKDTKGLVSKEIPVFALTLTGSEGCAIIAYFTRSTGQLVERFEYRRSPNQASKSSFGAAGITSVQFVDPTSNSHIFRDSFSARLFIGSRTSDRVSGSINIVFADPKRSFVSGSFKARLVGF